MNTVIKTLMVCMIIGLSQEVTMRHQNKKKVSLDEGGIGEILSGIIEKL